MLNPNFAVLNLAYVNLMRVKQLTTETFHYKTSPTFLYSLIRHFFTGTSFLYMYDISLHV